LHNGWQQHLWRQAEKIEATTVAEIGELILGRRSGGCGGSFWWWWQQRWLGHLTDPAGSNSTAVG